LFHPVTAGVWIPALMRLAGAFELSVELETAWCFLLAFAVLFVTLIKGVKIAIGNLLELFLISLVVVALIRFAGVPTRLDGLETVYGRLAAFAALLLLNLVPAWIMETEPRAVSRAERRTFPAAERAPAALMALAILLNVVFVISVREHSQTEAVASLPALALAVYAGWKRSSMSLKPESDADAAAPPAEGVGTDGGSSFYGAAS